MQFGNLIHHALSNTKDSIPTVGDGVTVLMWSDRRPGTITRVSKTGKSFWYKEDDAERIDNNGMSESQDYKFTPNDSNPEIGCRLHKDGRWHNSHGSVIKIGERDKYYDYSF